MKLLQQISMIFFLALTLTAGPAAAGTGKALFINWRGSTPCDQGLRDGLKEQGIALDIETFNAAQDKAALDAFLSSLDETAYDFIYTFGTTVSKKTAARIKNTPILFGIVTNPLKSGLIQSWESSGNNVTGVSHAIPMTDQVEFLFMLGEFKKIGMMFNPKETNSQIADKDLSRELAARGVAYLTYPVESAADITAAAKKAAADKIDLIYLPSDSFIGSQAKNITGQLSGLGIPSYGAIEKIVKSGATIGIVSSYYTVGKEISLKAGEILKGKTPSDIPSNLLPLDLQTVLISAKGVEQVKLEIPYDILSAAKILE